MSRRPLIGLSGRRWPVERVPHLPQGALHGEEVDLHLSEYPKGISAVGGLPVQLTRDADPVDMISRLDGLVMTGGADPDPVAVRRGSASRARRDRARPRRVGARH